MSEQVKERKEKILNWLKEEGLSPTEMADPNAYFNFGITLSGMKYNVLQNVRKLDSIFVGANLVLTTDQLSLLKNNMNKTKRQEFFWNLRLSLLGNPELGDFVIKPNPPDDVREVFVSSKPIYYDTLSKDRLMSSIFAVGKAIPGIIWTLERDAGAVTPRQNHVSSGIA